MTLDQETRSSLEKLMKEYGIVFPKNVPEESWPPNHLDIFKKIQRLGTYKYDEYAADGENSSLNERPWKYLTKRLAKKLTEKAEQCVRRNEASWRFACEPLVFARFSAEVACRVCRKRVWRSEIEASPTENSRGAEQLKRRQHQRESCRCPRSARPQDFDEVNGLNRLFIDRADEFVIHDSELTKKLPKGDKPDRIYGLRQTRNFEDLLYASAGEDRLVRDLFKRSPLSEDGCPLLFPFLVVEAKSSKSSDDWYSIKLQTAFPIYTFLESQRSLKLATGQRSNWHTGPLVWFFMNKGEDWRLCLAYQRNHITPQRSRISTETHIVEVWKGSIEVLDEALQLFLIVDYICDWARDNYREAIKSELRLLSSSGNSELASVQSDTDIWSIQDLHQQSDFTSWHNSNSENNNEAASFYAGFRAMDSREGIVRHASFIETRFAALFINNDSVQTLLQSTQEKILQYFARLILGQIHKKSVLLTSEQLNTIEENWTGTTRFLGPYGMTGTSFYTVITIISYMTPSWEQVRELSIIAVARDAFDSLVAASGLKQGKGKAQTPIVPDLDGSLVVSAVAHLKSGSIRHNLLAAIKRIALCISDRVRRDKVSLSVNDATTWELVRYVYNSFKRGRLEPTEPFLRVSKKMETQSVDSSDEGPFGFSDTLAVSSFGAVLIHGDAHNHDVKRDEQSSLCVFLVTESLEAPGKDTLATIITETFQDYDVYHTTRNNNKINIKQRNAPWNIKNPYGVHFSYGGPSFPKWLRSLNASFPKRQGSRRDSSDFGNLVNREYSPWHDPRLIHGGPFTSQKRRFLQLLISFEFQYWRKTAQERYKQGVRCCASCAKVLEDSWGVELEDLCYDCWYELHRGRYPEWFRDEIRKSLELRLRSRSSEEKIMPDEEISLDYHITTPSPSPVGWFPTSSDDDSDSEDSTSSRSQISAHFSRKRKGSSRKRKRSSRDETSSS